MPSIIKVAVVTGASKGVGLAIARELCQSFHGTVYLTSRDEDRGKAVLAQLEKLGLHPSYHQLDIDSPESIRTFKQYLAKKYGGIDVLINGAELCKTTEKESFAEQARNIVRVNFFGTLNVCKELFPLLRKHARVVHLSSPAGHLLEINGQEPGATELRNIFSAPDARERDISNLANVFIKQAEDDTHFEWGWPNSSYTISKVCVTALAPIQQRAFDSKRSNEGIIVNVVNPGEDYSIEANNKNAFPNSVEEAADAAVYLALLPPNATTPRGEFVNADRQIIDWVHGPASY